MNVIPWWDWLMCPSPELKKRGLDPAERIRFTGHARPLSPRWARTIGMWCLREPKEIIQVVAPDWNKERSRAIFDMFKNRNHLKTRRHWMRDNTEFPSADLFLVNGPVIVATFAHARITGHIGRSGGVLSPGAAAAAANRIAVATEEKDKQWVWTAEENTFGLLPIEMLLYYYAIEHVLEESGLTVARWRQGLGPGDAWADRSKLWKNYDGDSMVALPAEAMERYPVDDA